MLAIKYSTRGGFKMTTDKEQSKLKLVLNRVLEYCIVNLQEIVEQIFFKIK